MSVFTEFSDLQLNGKKFLKKQNKEFSICGKDVEDQEIL